MRVFELRSQPPEWRNAMQCGAMNERTRGSDSGSYAASLMGCLSRGMLGSQAGNNGGGWQFRNLQLASRERKDRVAGSARHDNNIRVCRSCWALLMLHRM